MKLDLARWNHVLIPATKAGRDKYRRGAAWRVLRPVVAAFARMSREGRLLATTGCVAAAFAADVGRTDAHVLIFALAALITASLLFSRRYALTGVTVEARAPRRIAIGEEVAVTLSLRNAGPREHRAIRVDPPLLPWDGAWTRRPETLDAIVPEGRATIELFARFSARGEHHLDRFQIAALVPLGSALAQPSGPWLLHIDNDLDARLRVANWLSPLCPVQGVADLQQARALPLQAQPPIIIADPQAQGSAEEFCKALLPMTRADCIILFSDAVDNAFVQGLGLAWLQKAHAGREEILLATRLAIGKLNQALAR